LIWPWLYLVNRQKNGCPHAPCCSGRFSSLILFETATRTMDLNILKDTPPWDWPEDTAEMLMEILRDRRRAASDRVIAANLAGDYTVASDQMADVLLSIVRDAGEPERLRARAAISLGPMLEGADTEGFDDDFSEPPISERVFHEIQETLQRIYLDEGEPKEVRRRILEASVRAAQDWHSDAIRAAASSDDEDWKLTATFAMQWVEGFDEQILEMLRSRNPDIHYEAVCAAGEQEVDAAWPHIAALINSMKTEKRLLLAAIVAAGNIRPREAKARLTELADSEDEDIAEAADEALLMAEPPFDPDDEEI